MLFSRSENPAPALLLACITTITALALIGVSLLVVVTASLLAWSEALAAREQECRGRDRTIALQDSCPTAQHLRRDALVPGKYGELQ